MEIWFNIMCFSLSFTQIFPNQLRQFLQQRLERSTRFLWIKKRHLVLLDYLIVLIIIAKFVNTQFHSKFFAY